MDDRDDRADHDDRAWQSGPAFRAGLVLDGRYRLLRPLGEGGMGAVWVALQIALEREVAVKVLHGTVDAQRPRLRHEALALAAVHHPAVVQVHDYGETDAGVPYVVMELVRGEPLSGRLRRAGALPAEEAVALALPLLDGLAAAHRAGVVHRDIKPENVILTPTTGGVAPRLLDFGIARIDGADASQITGEGGVVGTPAYMAPEQVRGGEVDERADVWGAGVLIYELIAGVTPFAADDLFQVLRGLVQRPPPYPRRARGLDGPLWAILMGALRKDVAARTPSARALRDALAGWLEGRPRAPATPLFAEAPPRSSRLAATLDAGAAPAARGAPDPGPETTDRAPGSIDALIRAKLGDR